MLFHAVIPSAASGIQSTGFLHRTLHIPEIGPRLDAASLDVEFWLEIDGYETEATALRWSKNQVDLLATFRTLTTDEPGPRQMEWRVETVIIATGFRVAPWRYPAESPDVMMLRSSNAVA